MDAEQELAQLRARVAHLEALVAQAAAGPPASGPASEGFSRRRMLRNGLGLSAAAVAGVGMLDAVGSSAAASDGDAVTIAATKSPTGAASAATRILNPSATTHSPVLFQVDNTTNRTVALPDNTRAAIVATFAGNDDTPTLQSAVLGIAELGNGVEGRSEAFRGVSGVTLGGAGVHGETTGFAGIGVEGVAEGGVAVSATATTGKAVVASSDSGEAVHATSTDNVAIYGKGSFGVVGDGGANGTGVGAEGSVGVLAHGDVAAVDATSVHGVALKATATDGTGVKASAPGNIGVDAEGGFIAVQATGLGGGTAIKAVAATGPGVVATSSGSPGVHGTSAQDAGVWGESTASAYPGVLGSHAGDGTGVVGLSQTGTGVSGGSTSGVGVEAGSSSGAGLSATSTHGVGARLQGGAAAVRLVPQGVVGPPTTGGHQRGELLVDAKGKPWLCTKGGTPGTWRQLAFA